MAIELYPYDTAFGMVWRLEFTSLATGPIEVEGGEHFDRRYADLYPPRADGTLRWAAGKGRCSVPRDPRRAGPRDNPCRAVAADERTW